MESYVWKNSYHFDEESAFVNDPVFSRAGISEYARKSEKKGLKKRGQSNRDTQH